MKPGKIGNPTLAEQWLPFVYFLVNEQENIDRLQDVLSRCGVKQKEPGDQPRQYPLPEKPPLNKTPELTRLLGEAGQVGLVNNVAEENGKISFELTSIQAHFLNGHWLEAYVWNEATKLGIFSDCRWDLELFYNGIAGNKPGNQLDVSMIYKAQLFLVECKTGESDFFKKEVLDELDSTAQMLGKGFVGKFVVATWLGKPYNQESYANERQEKIERFRERAKYLGIEVVTREQLATIRTIIENLAQSRTRG